MFNFAAKLKSELNDQIVRIEQQEDKDIIYKASQAVVVLEIAYNKLKNFAVAEYQFQNEQGEILFFKEIKPKLNSRLIFYRKVYNIEMNRPGGGFEIVSQYLNTEIEVINHWMKRGSILFATTVAIHHIWTTIISFEEHKVSNNITKRFSTNAMSNTPPPGILKWLDYLPMNN